MTEVALSYNTHADTHQVTIDLDKASYQQAMEDASAWFRSVAQTKLAKIVECPEYAKVTALEQRRDEAAATLESMTERIEQIKGDCVTNILDDTASMDSAAQEIEVCGKAVASAQLTLDSVSAVLPEATSARQAITKDAVMAALKELRDDLLERERVARQAVDKKIMTAALVLLSSHRCKELLEAARRRAGVELVLESATEHGTGGNG